MQNLPFITREENHHPIISRGPSITVKLNTCLYSSHKTNLLIPHHVPSSGYPYPLLLHPQCGRLQPGIGQQQGTGRKKIHSSRTAITTRFGSTTVNQAFLDGLESTRQGGSERKDRTAQPCRFQECLVPGVDCLGRRPTRCFVGCWFQVKVRDLRTCQ